MDDSTLLRGFQSCDLAHEKWCHRVHVRLAYLFLRDHRFSEALARFRVNLQRYNLAHLVPNDLASGYHETLTVAWFRIVVARMHDKSGALDSDAFCDANADLLDNSMLRRFYSREQIVSWEAKHDFVLPDLQELPGAGRRATSGCS